MTAATLIVDPEFHPLRAVTNSSNHPWPAVLTDITTETRLHSDQSRVVFSVASETVLSYQETNPRGRLTAGGLRPAAGALSAALRVFLARFLKTRDAYAGRAICAPVMPRAAGDCANVLVDGISAFRIGPYERRPAGSMTRRGARRITEPNRQARPPEPASVALHGPWRSAS